MPFLSSHGSQSLHEHLGSRDAASQTSGTALPARFDLDQCELEIQDVCYWSPAGLLQRSAMTPSSSPAHLSPGRPPLDVLCGGPPRCRDGPPDWRELPAPHWSYIHQKFRSAPLSDGMEAADTNDIELTELAIPRALEQVYSLCGLEQERDKAISCLLTLGKKRFALSSADKDLLNRLVMQRYAVEDNISSMESSLREVCWILTECGHRQAAAFVSG